MSSRNQMPCIDTLTDQNFVGKHVVVTGKFSKYIREVIKSIIEQMGGTFQNSITKQTDLVLVGTFKGNGFSRKYNLAINYHIEIMEESSFYKVVKEHELQRSLF